MGLQLLVAAYYIILFSTGKWCFLPVYTVGNTQLAPSLKLGHLDSLPAVWDLLTEIIPSKLEGH